LSKLEYYMHMIFSTILEKHRQDRQTVKFLEFVKTIIFYA